MTDSEPRPGIRLADLPLGVRPCPLAAALEVLGERWSLLALREIGYGVHRFARIAGYTGASRDILADRLGALEGAAGGRGRPPRAPPHRHPPPRHESHLAQAGRELFPVMLALYQGGDKWAVDSPALVRRHACG